MKELIAKLKRENNERTAKMSTGTLEQSHYSILVHLYNYTLDIIKQLEAISPTNSIH